MYMFCIDAAGVVGGVVNLWPIKFYLGRQKVCLSDCRFVMLLTLVPFLAVQFFLLL